MSARASNYRGHKIVVEVTGQNNVYVSVKDSAGDSLFREICVASSGDLSDEELEVPGALAKLRVQKAWQKGRRYVDERLHLEEALRHCPEWELKS